MDGSNPTWFLSSCCRHVGLRVVNMDGLGEIWYSMFAEFLNCFLWTTYDKNTPNMHNMDVQGEKDPHECSKM